MSRTSGGVIRVDGHVVVGEVGEEDLGVGAYNGAGPKIKDKKILASAGSIVQIEGRHAGAIRFLNGEKIAPSPFDKGLEMADVLKAAKPFIKA